LIPNDVVVDVIVELLGCVDENADFAPHIGEQIVVRKRQRAGNGLSFFLLE